MKILVINTGSSSLKYKLFDMLRNEALSGGIVERIGEKDSGIRHTFFLKDKEKSIYIKKRIVDQNQAMHEVVSLITDVKNGGIDTIEDIDAIGHRVVQGGEKLKTAILVTAEVKTTIKGIRSRG